MDTFYLLLNLLRVEISIPQYSTTIGPSLTIADDKELRAEIQDTISRSSPKWPYVNTKK